MKKVIILCMLLMLLIPSVQSQYIKVDGRTFIVTETIDLSDTSGVTLYGVAFSQFDGVYEIDLSMSIYGDVTGKFVSDFSVNGMQNALGRCRVNNYSFFDLPDGAMVIDEFTNDSIFMLDMDNIYFNGQGYTYTEIVVIELPKPFKNILNRDNITFHITKRSDEDTVFLIDGNYDSSVLFNITGSSCCIRGITFKFLHKNDSLAIFGLYGDGLKEVKYNSFEEIWIENN